MVGAAIDSWHLRWVVMVHVLQLASSPGALELFRALAALRDACPNKPAVTLPAAAKGCASTNITTLNASCQMKERDVVHS